MTDIYLPTIATEPEVLGTRDAGRVGYALYGVDHSRNHDLLASGYPVQNWYARACDLAYPTFYPALWGPRWWLPVKTIERLATDFTGRTWLLWNEPNVQSQANLAPGDCLGITQEWAGILRDHGQRIAGFGVTITTQPRADIYPWRDWLRTWLALPGRPTVDAWHIHIYAETAQAWADLYGFWQAWNLAEGGNLPTIVSEAGTTRDVWQYVCNLADSNLEAVLWFTDRPQDWLVTRR